MRNLFQFLFRLIVSTIFFCVVPDLLLAQHSFTGTHNGHENQQRSLDQQDMPGICEHLKSLVMNHEHEDAKELIYETLKENPQQPDCFFYNARLYFHHKLSGRDKHSKPLLDSLMVLYDNWFAVSRSPNVVLNWKGRDIRDFYYKEPDSLRKYCAMYKRIYDADKENMHPFNLKVLASCACDLHGKMDIDSLWRFTKHQSETHQEAPWKASYKSLKREMILCQKIPCTKLHDLLHPVLASGKEGSEETHKLHVMLNQRGCSGYEHHTVSSQKPATVQKKVENPNVELKTLETIPSSEPVQESKTTKAVAPEVADVPTKMQEEPVKMSAYEVLLKTANINMQNKEYALALKNFEEAMKSGSSPIEKADGYLGMALASDSLKDFVKAKEYAMTVHHMLPDELDGMKFIAQLYQKSEVFCGFKTEKERAAYYILLSTIAWNLSNSEESDAWKEKAELADLYRTGKAKKGDKVKVGCFINEEVELP